MPRNTQTNALLTLIVETLKLAPKFQSQGDELTRDLNLTSSRWTFLGTLANADKPLTVPDIARRMTLKPQTVQRFADAALAEGFVALEENPDHKRARLVRLTSKGKDILGLLEKRESAWARSIVGNIPADEIMAAAKTMEKIRAHIVTHKA
jgi:DNA-binding MarR family transcriptional regulator